MMIVHTVSLDYLLAFNVFHQKGRLDVFKNIIINALKRAYIEILLCHMWASLQTAH